MIHGHFDVRTFDTPDLTPARLDELIGPRSERRPGSIDKLLEQWKPVQKAVGKNLIFDRTMAYFLYWVFQEGLTKIDLPDPWDFSGGSGWCPFSSITWETTDTEPTYTEAVSIYTDIQNTTGRVASGCAKRFIDDDVENHYIYSDPDGREAITFRSRWLWLPGDFSSNNIRSIAAWWCENGNYTGTDYRNRSSRIRLKDSGGSPIIINKTANQSLFAEYKVTLVTV